MTRLFSNVKSASAFIAHEISAVATRRGFATAIHGVAVKNGAQSVMLKKGSEEPTKIAWIPDPVTGYYRPENQTKEMDPAELREMLINNKSRGH